MICVNTSLDISQCPEAKPTSVQLPPWRHSEKIKPKEGAHQVIRFQVPQSYSLCVVSATQDNGFRPVKTDWKGLRTWMEQAILYFLLWQHYFWKNKLFGDKMVNDYGYVQQLCPPWERLKYWLSSGKSGICFMMIISLLNYLQLICIRVILRLLYDMKTVKHC